MGSWRTGPEITESLPPTSLASLEGVLGSYDVVPLPVYTCMHSSGGCTQAQDTEARKC